MTRKGTHHFVAMITVDSLILDVSIDYFLHGASANYQQQQKTQGVVKENKEIIDLAPNLPINIVGYFSTVKQNLEYQFV